MPKKEDWKISLDYELTQYYGYGILSIPLFVKIEEFHIFYNAELETVTQPFSFHKMSPNSLNNYVDYVGVTDYFPLIVYSSVDLHLPYQEKNELNKKTISALLEQANIEVNDIHHLETDETKRERIVF